MLQEFLVQIITSSVVSAVLAGLLLWLTRSWISERLKNQIKNEYDQRLETHKAQLKAQSDVEVEKLRSQLKITATEHEVRFSQLHEKRAEVIAETYALLKELYVRLGDYVKIVEIAGDTPKEQRRDAAAIAHKSLREYYPKRLIFLPKSTANKVQNIDVQLVRTFNEFVFDVEMNKNSGYAQKWMEIFERVNGEIKEALEELEDEFRTLLGDES